MGFCCVYFTNFDKLPDFHQTISSLPKNSAVIFREYNLKKPKRQELAAKIQKICQKYQHKFIIGKDLQLAKRLRADGAHFSDHDNINLDKKLSNMIITLSCHHLNSIKKTRNADVLFFSPIFMTNSHPGASPKGLLQLKKAQKLSQKPEEYFFFKLLSTVLP